METTERFTDPFRERAAPAGTGRLFIGSDGTSRLVDGTSRLVWARKPRRIGHAQLPSKVFSPYRGFWPKGGV